MIILKFGPEPNWRSEEKTYLNQGNSFLMTQIKNTFAFPGVILKEAIKNN